ncbi:MAG: hypothetical protein ACOX5Z_05650 [Desulfobulbus sp.]
MGIVLTCLLLAGCSGMQSGSSFTGPLPDTAVTGISRDAAERLAELYPPGHTTLHLAHPPETQRHARFGELLENDLRAKGFRIAPAGGPVTTVSWTVDALADTSPPTSWYMRLQVADKTGTRTISRVYNSHGAPQGGFAESTF